MRAYNPIIQYREAAAALRAIARNNGKTAATTSAIERREADKGTAINALMAAGERGIVGLLVEEEKLANRDWQNRPELKARILQIRRELRQLEASL